MYSAIGCSKGTELFLLDNIPIDPGCRWNYNIFCGVTWAVLWGLNRQALGDDNLYKLEVQVLESVQFYLHSLCMTPQCDTL
jgi:hypothetical protein